MKQKKMIILSLLLVMGLIFVSSSEAANVSKDSEKNNETVQIKASNVINLGEMRIEEKKCTINLEYDNVAPIRDCSPYETYAFVIQYYFHEASINQEKWVFRMSMQTGTNGEKTLVDEKIIEDSWALTDMSDGELWVELPGYKLWEGKEYNYITLECITYSDIAWLSDYTLVDESHEMTQATVKNYLKPKLEIDALDGTDYGKVGVRVNYPEKVFIVENTGTWVAKNVSYELLGHPDFYVSQGPKGEFDLQPNEQKQITIIFNPQKRGEKSASLRASDGQYLFSSEEIKLKGYGRVTKSKGILFSSNIFDRLIEKSPIFEELLTSLL